MFSMMGLLYYFYKTWSTDPGYIKTSEEERKEVGDFGKTNERADVVLVGLFVIICSSVKLESSEIFFLQEFVVISFNNRSWRISPTACFLIFLVLL